MIIKPISIAWFLVGLSECWSSRDNHVTERNVLPLGLIKVSMDDYDHYDGHDDYDDMMTMVVLMTMVIMTEMNMALTW